MDFKPLLAAYDAREASMDIESLIASHEGLRLRVYLCPAGKLTIGYGRNLDERGITEEEARLLLANDITDFHAQLMGRLGGIFTRLDPVRQAVLIDMAFNLGINGLLKFKAMLTRLAAKDYAGAAEEMAASHWAAQVKGRALTLIAMTKTGEWPAKRVVLHGA